MASKPLNAVWKWLRRGLRAVVALIVFYCLFLLIGLIPLNRSFKPAADGVSIYVVSSAVHADIVVPLDHPACDWRDFFPLDDFADDTAWATHVAIGWGDRGFYLQTPTWNDLKASTALNAMLLPSTTVVHASCMTRPQPRSGATRIDLSGEQYAALCRSIQRSLPSGQARPTRRIAGASYHAFDAFYESTGSYHALNTCNSWVGRQLAAAGVSTPLWTPLPGSPCWYLDSP